MRVCVYKSRENDAATRIHDFTVGIYRREDLIRASNPFDPWPTNEQRTGRHNAHLAHLRPDPRTRRASQRHHLRTVDNRECQPFLFPNE
jgi:hypothetical protein